MNTELGKPHDVTTCRSNGDYFVAYFRHRTHVYVVTISDGVHFAKNTANRISLTKQSVLRWNKGRQTTWHAEVRWQGPGLLTRDRGSN